jgi:hypothetical protein
MAVKIPSALSTDPTLSIGLYHLYEHRRNVARIIGDVIAVRTLTDVVTSYIGPHDLVYHMLADGPIVTLTDNVTGDSRTILCPLGGQIRSQRDGKVGIHALRTDLHGR